jgi:hypothetical protein
VYSTKQRIEEIEQRRLLLSQRKHSPPRPLPDSKLNSTSLSYGRNRDKTPSEISQANLTVYDLNGSGDELYDDVNLFFGEEAKENFWDLYKSERRFKDFNQGSD